MDKARTVSLFIAVVRARSFSRAASEAGLTPQAVSKAVRQLETYLGVRLLHRTTRSLSPTDDGLRLFELANPGLRLLDEALDQVQTSRQEAEGLIRIAAPSSMANRQLVPLIRDFQRIYPGAVFDVLLEDHFTDLVEAKIDIGFRAGNPPERNLVARKLSDLPLLVCAAPAYLKQFGAPANAAELTLHRCTGFRQPNSGRMVPWELHIDGGTVYQDVSAVCSFNNVEAEVAAVLAGVGIGQLALYLIADELAQGRLVAILPQLATANGGLYMYYPQRTQMPLRVRNFIDFVSQAAPGVFPQLD
ncbi:LysR family transcriptional regulator [Janthinobacterium agaricidamnosum]|uniref:Bacterial regulatory helix-turn-helix, lysR family protein n=1 Tax=Janthinobacterium agaricidamnosum NBRC 102515 = DSM 9628 TaxID=1349767 RepID=W0V713_9BURK|nr:LysR family transcriptional regulator [Janthinobacterium agaricidamnosum]CDG83671.1 bacterial regulatory helix-turn-helix, lysR family protein [Janthinobacterium agaricidamnosum NBRC 102515 = DSM 9628]